MNTKHTTILRTFVEIVPTEQIAQEVDDLRTAAVTVYDYLFVDQQDPLGYTIALEAYERHYNRLVAIGYEPAALFALCAERLASRARLVESVSVLGEAVRS